MDDSDSSTPPKKGKSRAFNSKDQPSLSSSSSSSSARFRSSSTAEPRRAHKKGTTSFHRSSSHPASPAESGGSPAAVGSASSSSSLTGSASVSPSSSSSSFALSASSSSPASLSPGIKKLVGSSSSSSISTTVSSSSADSLQSGSHSPRSHSPKSVEKGVERFFAALASRTMIAPLLPVLVEQSNYRELYAGLAIFCDRRQAFQKVVKDLFQKDLKIGSDSVLLREETHCTRLVAGFLHVYATPSLNTIFKKEIAYIGSRKALKLIDGQKQLSLFNSLLNCVASLKKKLVQPAIKILMLMSETLSQERGEDLASSFRRVCGSLLFLRFLCPFLVAQVSRLFSQIEPDLLPKVKQGYFNVVKMLQCLASGTTLDPGVPNSTLLNQAISKKAKIFAANIDDLFKTACSLKNASGRLSHPLGPVPTPERSGCLSLKKIVLLARTFIAFACDHAHLIEHLVGEDVRSVFIDAAQAAKTSCESPRHLLGLLLFQPAELIFMQRGFR